MIPSEDNFSPLLCFGNAHVNVPTGKLSPQLSTEFEFKKVLFGAPFGAPLELKALSSACCLARVPATGYCISLQHFLASTTAVCCAFLLWGKVLLRRNYINPRPFAGFARRTLEGCMCICTSSVPMRGDRCDSASSLACKRNPSLWLFLLLVVFFAGSVCGCCGGICACVR